MRCYITLVFRTIKVIEIPYIDTIAPKFPDLEISMGYMGYPWVADTVAVAWKHENVYIDTSA